MNSLPSVSLLNLPSGAITANGDTLAAYGVVDVNYIEEILLGINISAVTGTAPTITFSFDSLGTDGIWYPLYTSPAQTAVGKIVRTISASNSMSLGRAIRLSWVVGGTTPSFTFSASMIGK